MLYCQLVHFFLLNMSIQRISKTVLLLLLAATSLFSKKKGTGFTLEADFAQRGMIQPTCGGI